MRAVKLQASSVIKTDILIIGGGLAGMMAALAARSHGCKVAVVSKAPVGRSGNTLVSGGGISSATDEPVNDADTFLRDINLSGQGLNDDVLSRKLVFESFAMLQILQKYGVNLLHEQGGYKRRQPPGHSVPRNIPTDWSGLSYLNRGLSFTLPLLAELHKQEVQLYEGIQIVKLLKNETSVVGAWGCDRNGQGYCFYAQRVILATGGGGQLYLQTNNTGDITADGLALALEAGCKLRDMEQIQFYPTMMFKPSKVPASNPLFGEGAVLRNRMGELFMQRYDPAGNMATRDSMARAIFMEIKTGNGIDNSVYFDCTGIAADRLKTRFKDFYEFMCSMGVDPSKDYMLVSPCVHYFLGGIVIDEYCRTGINGLYAAGEICGGVHGANRLSGAALMEACVFGWQAGETAADELEPRKAIGIAVEEGLLSSQKFAATQLRAIRTIMWENVSLIRNENGLMAALEYVEAAKYTAVAMTEKAMLSVAETIIRSALLRRESRGAHYRSDYPDVQKNYRGNTICWQDNSELKVNFQQNHSAI